MRAWNAAPLKRCRSAHRRCTTVAFELHQEHLGFSTLKGSLRIDGTASIFSVVPLEQGMLHVDERALRKDRLIIFALGTRSGGSLVHVRSRAFESMVNSPRQSGGRDSIEIDNG